MGERRITEDSTWGGGRKFPVRVSTPNERSEEALLKPIKARRER